jgi:probable F420-dependent oxidoreductase
MKLGKLGVWASLDGMIAREAADFARLVEDHWYSALWCPEGMGRDVLVNAGWLLANTSTLVIASGIANLYARDAVAMAAARNQLNEQSDGRFLLGIGISHAPIVGGIRGHAYGKPIPTMRGYLAAMREAPYLAPPPAGTPVTVLAALGPQMIALSGEQADGAHPYNVTPFHTAEARRILGAGKLLCVEQKVILQTDPARARSAARSALAIYLPLANYQASWRREGFEDADFADSGSDRLVDALVAWGDVATLRARIEQHWAAGADHVCIQALSAESVTANRMPAPDIELVKLLATLA